MAAICIPRWSIFVNLPVSSLCCPEWATDNQQSDRLLNEERRRKTLGVLQSDGRARQRFGPGFPFADHDPHTEKRAWTR
jgi:hypothetical protein